jgi:hypothetical protein
VTPPFIRSAYNGKNIAQYNPQFYSKTVNLTKFKFTKEEMNLLNYGLQHSIEKPLKTYWINLIMETKQAIKTLGCIDAEPIPDIGRQKLQQILNSISHYNATQKRYAYIIKKLRLVKEDAIIARADKGKNYCNHILRSSRSQNQML